MIRPHRSPIMIGDKAVIVEANPASLPTVVVTVEKTQDEPPKPLPVVEVKPAAMAPAPVEKEKPVEVISVVEPTPVIKEEPVIEIAPEPVVEIAPAVEPVVEEEILIPSVHIDDPIETPVVTSTSDISNKSNKKAQKNNKKKH